MNDAPVVTAPGSALSATEQVGLSIHGSGFSVNDVDDANGTARAVLSAAEGVVTIVEGDSGVTIDSGNNSGSVTLLGTIAQIDNLLTGSSTGTITYLNHSNTPSTSTTFTTLVNDSGNTGSDPGLTGDATSEEGSAARLINITPVNDSPSISLSPVVTSLNEDADTSNPTVVATINISDDDLGVETLTLSGTDASLFEIVGNELRLVAGAALDFETNAWLDVTVNVDDATIAGTPDDSNNHTVSIDDVNEAPSILLTPLISDLNEDADTSSPIVVATISVVDDDLGIEILSLGGADAAIFEIVGNDLRLVAGTALDFETNPTLDVAVNVDDPSIPGTPDDSANHSVTLSDANEPPTDIVPNTVAVNENINTSGGFSLATLTTADQDSLETFFYSILTGIDSALFTIGGVGNDELILDDGILDHEATSSYGVNVRVADSALNFYDEMLIITVNDINDAPTISSASLSVAENQALVGNLVATDEDIPANSLTWSISGAGADDGLLSINAVTGILTFTTAPDFELPGDADADNVYQVDVQVNDGTTSVTQPITVAVTNINEAPSIGVPGPQVTNEDTPLVFSNANGNAIVVGDADAGNNPVIVTLTASSGTLTLGSTLGLTFVTGDGTADSSVTIAGSLTEINSALTGLRFNPNTNFAGNASIQVNVNDQGNVGTGRPLFALDTIYITVNASNDSPVANSDTYSVNSGELLVVNAPGILVNDLDADGDPLTAILEAGPAHGTLSLASDGAFVYVPDLGYTGTDSFTYRVTDGVDTSAPSSVTVDVPQTIVPPTPDTDDDATEDPVREESDENEPPVVATPQAPDPTSHEPYDGDSPDGYVPDGGAPIQLSTEPPILVEEPEVADQPRVMIGLPRLAVTNRSIDRALDSKLARFEIIDSSADFETRSLFAAMDSIVDAVAQDGHLFRLVAGTSIIATGTLSAGVVLWTARAGYFVTLLSSSLPAWASIDPIPVLDSVALEERKEREVKFKDAETLVDIAEGQET